MAPSASDDNAICYVLPVLWMTLCLAVLAIIGQARAMQIGRILNDSPGVITADEV